MNPYRIILVAPLLVLLVWAIVEDVRARRIPNWLVLLLAAAGIAQSFLPQAPVSPAASFYGLLVGLAVPFPLFVLGAVYAGDVKLMAAVGAWIGPWPALWVMALAAILGGILAIVQSLWRRNTLLLFQRTAVLGVNLLQGRGAGALAVDPAAPVKAHNTLPYALPIGVATLAQLIRAL